MKYFMTRVLLYQQIQHQCNCTVLKTIQDEVLHLWGQSDLSQIHKKARLGKN